MQSKILKNTGFLYFRTVLTILIALYTSRVLLHELGVDDFGVYTVIGGVVAMFSSLRGVFASSIQRFLNYEMGNNTSEGLKKIFSMSITLHVIISIVFILLVESVGLWFIYNKLVIDPTRLTAAIWVFHLSIAASVVTIMTVPYDAVIIAHEKMDVFAYLSILDAVLKLAIIFTLQWINMDKLILYAVLIFLVSVIVRLISAIYSKRNFDECTYKFTWDKNLFKEMGAFAGWNFFGNMAYTLTNEGANLLLNIFGGTPVNAARGISYQVRGAVGRLASNIQTASNPQLVQLWAKNEKEKMFHLFYTVSKFSFFLLLLMVVPLIFFTTDILNIWLGIVPEHAAVFIQLIMSFLLIRSFHGPLDTLFKAKGEIRLYQIIDATILFLNLPLSYTFLKIGYSVEVVFIIMVFVEVINLSSISLLAKRVVKLPLREYLLKVILPCVISAILAFSVAFFVIYYFPSKSIYHTIIMIITTVLSTTISVLAVGLKSVERKTIFSYVKKLIR